MRQINLLPWREKSRRIKKRRLMAGTLASVIFALLFVLTWHLMLSSKLRKEDYVLSFYQNELRNEENAIASTDARQQELAKTQTQLKFIMGLYERSYAGIALLNELTRLVPQNIALTRVIRKNNKVLLSGTAKSDSEVTEFLQLIKNSSFFSNVELSHIASSKSGQREFQINLEQREMTRG